MGTVNRFLGIDGQSRERLVVVPAQFQAAASAGVTGTTTGTLRLYNEIAYDVYHAPFTATDFIAPSVWQVEAVSTTKYLEFGVQVTDDREEIERTVVLYRTLSSERWLAADLAYDGRTGWARGREGPVTEPFEYVVQVVDGTGNVAMVLDHGNPFQRWEEREVPEEVYLPLVNREYAGLEHRLYLPVIMR